MEPSRNDIPNRRRAIRRKPRPSSKITVFKNSQGLGSNIALTLVDVSETGARVVVKEALLPGQEVELNLLGVGHSRPCKTLSRVMWCTETPEKNWRIGVQFDKALPFRDLQQIV